MRRYTAKEREQAAQVCDALAAAEAHEGFALGFTFVCFEVFDFSGRVRNLALDAFFAVPARNSLSVHIPLYEQYAEAAAWLRTGWTP